MAPFRDNFRDASMLLRYARVSTDDQDLALQRRALREAGCRRFYEEKLSGARRDRPELARLLDQVREDDVLVVTRLDRLARSTRDLLDIAEAARGRRRPAQPRRALGGHHQPRRPPRYTQPPPPRPDHPA